ncbi:uncharacterized protein LOC144868658 [Branchiostoma floridae x Branchiostoma japonicum]
MELTETTLPSNFLTSFKWSERSIALGVLLDNYRLPQVVRLPRDHQVRVGTVQLAGDQHVLLGEARRVRRVVAQAVELRSFLPVGPKLSIPLDFRGRFLLLPLEGWQAGVRHFETVSELTASFPDKVYAKEDIHLDVFDGIVKTPDKKKVAKTFKHPIVQRGDVLTLLAVKKAYRVSKTTKKPKKGSSKAVDCLICANQKNERVALPISFPGKFVTVHNIEEIVKNYRLPVMVQLVQGQAPAVDNFTGVLTLMETGTDHSVQARLVSPEGEIDTEPFRIPVIGKKIQFVPPEAMLLNTAEYKQNLADWLEGNWRGPPANGHVSNGSVLLRETPRNGELMTVQATLHQETPSEEVGRPSAEGDVTTADSSSRVVSVDGSIYEYLEGSNPQEEKPEVRRHVTLAEIVLEDSSTDPPDAPQETVESSADRAEGAPPAPDYPAPLPPAPILTPDVAPPAPDYPAPLPPLQLETLAPLEAPPPVPDKPINIPERDYDPNPPSTPAPPPAQSEDKYGYMIPLDNDGLPVRDYPPEANTPSETTATTPLAGAALTSQILAMRQKILTGETKTEDTEDGQEDEDEDDPDWEPPTDLTIMTPREVTKFLRLAEIEEEAIQRFKAAGVDGKRLVGMPRDEMTDEFELTSQQSKDVFSFILESQIATKL